jgi:polyferredoxin
MVRQAAAGQTVVWPSVVKLTIIGVFLGAILLFRRPWCRMLCPLGVIFSAFNKVSVLFLRFDSGTCTSCGRCTKSCQYNIDPEQSPNDLRCIRCLECTRCQLGALTPHTVLHGREALAGSEPDKTVTTAAD